MQAKQHWFQRITAYHLLIDRFAGIPVTHQQYTDQPIFCGGQLRAIIDRLDYLQDLGIDTLWLSPFMKASPSQDAYHGYHVVDYQAVDERFGTLEDLDALIAAVHQRGMHVIADFVPNHVHYDAPMFFDKVEEKRTVKPGFEDWFAYKDDGTLSAYFGFKMIPQLNLDHPLAREYMIDSALFWLKRGIDGLRLDYAAGPSHDFWKVFRSTIKEQFPESVLIGEVWHEWLMYEHFDQVGLKDKASKVFRERISRDQLQAEYIGSLDGVLDFAFQSMMVHYFKAVQKHGASEKLSATFTEALQQHYDRYPSGFFLVSFLDNHDIDRFLFSVGGQLDYLKEAIDIQMAQQHPALMYYGTELGLTNRASIDRKFPYSDVMVRPVMPWGLMDQDQNTPMHKQAQEIHAHFRKAMRGRLLQ